MEFEIIHIEQLDSTNDYLQRALGSTSVEEGLVVSADEQLSGRGYGSNHWESERGKNLTFSLLLKPYHIEPANQFVISKLISNALIKALEKHLEAKKLAIKWPNDIYVDHGKIGGILIQNMIKGSRIDFSLVGIGLNINQEVFHPGTPNPISMIQLTRNRTDLSSLLTEILTEINNCYQRSFSPSYLEDMNKLYLKRLFRLDEWTDFKEGESLLRARIKGLGEFGKLKLETEDGTFRYFGFKEVEMII